MGSQCLMGYGAPTCDDEKILELESGDECTTLTNVLSATELCTLKWFYNKFCYVYFTTIKKLCRYIQIKLFKGMKYIYH